MNKRLFKLILCTFIAFPPLLAAAKETKVDSVAVTNFPPVQEVDGNVNVVNVPQVTIASGAALPVVTASVDTPGRQVFSKGSFLWLRAPNNRSTGIIVSNGEIPYGKVLVIDFIALNVLSEFEQNIVAVLRHKVPGQIDPRIMVRNVVAPLLPSLPLDPRDESWHYGSLMVSTRIYLERDSGLPDGEGVLLVSADRRETIGSVNTDFYVSGHLVDKLP